MAIHRVLASAWAVSTAVFVALTFNTATTHAQTSGQRYYGSAEDFMQISQLFARYNNTIDNGDGISWANTFTPNGVFRDPSHCAVGREQLIAIVGRNPTPGKDERSHHVHSLGPIVYLDHDHATVHSTVMVVSETGFGKVGGISVTGTYDDQLTRMNGSWLFAYRLVHRPSDKPAVACPPE